MKKHINAVIGMVALAIMAIMMFSVSITFAQVEPITVLSPNGGESYRVGDILSVRWSGWAATSQYKLMIYIDPSQFGPGFTQYIPITDAGATTIDAGVGHFEWKIDNVWSKMGINLPTTFKVRINVGVQETNGEWEWWYIYDWSDSSFTITEDLRLTISRSSNPWPEAMRISWPYEAGVRYRLMGSTNLLDWETVVAEVYTNNIAIATIGGANFFRVQKLPPALTVTKGNMPDSAILIAGSTSNYVAQFRLSAAHQGLTIDSLRIKMPRNFGSSTTTMMINYRDVYGINQQAYRTVTYPAGGSNAFASFTGLAMNVPTDGSETDLDIYIDVASSGFVHYGVGGAITLLANEGFSATGDSGMVVTSAGSADLNGNTFYIRKSKPTFTVLPISGTPATGKLLRFTVMADAAGNIDLKQLGFMVVASGCDVNDLYLLEPSTFRVLTDISVDPTNGIVKLPIGKAGDGDVLTIGTTPKTLEVWGTVANYSASAGDFVVIGFMKDTSPAANGSVSEVVGSGAYNIWSDQSASAHTVFTTDWTNGYLLEGMDQVQVFQK